MNYFFLRDGVSVILDKGQRFKLTWTFSTHWLGVAWQQHLAGYFITHCHFRHKALILHLSQTLQSIQAALISAACQNSL